MDVKERERGEQREVGGAEEGVRDVGEQRGAKEDHDDVEHGRQDQGEQEGEESGLERRGLVGFSYEQICCAAGQGEKDKEAEAADAQ